MENVWPALQFLIALSVSHLQFALNVQPQGILQTAEHALSAAH